MITGNCGVREWQGLQGRGPVTVYSSGRKCKLQAYGQSVPTPFALCYQFQAQVTGASNTGKGSGDEQIVHAAIWDL